MRKAISSKVDFITKLKSQIADMENSHIELEKVIAQHKDTIKKHVEAQENLEKSMSDLKGDLLSSAEVLKKSQQLLVEEQHTSSSLKNELQDRDGKININV